MPERHDALLHDRGYLSANNRADKFSCKTSGCSRCNTTTSIPAMSCSTMALQACAECNGRAGANCDLISGVTSSAVDHGTCFESVFGVNVTTSSGAAICLNLSSSQKCYARGFDSTAGVAQTNYACSADSCSVCSTNEVPTRPSKVCNDPSLAARYVGCNGRQGQNCDIVTGLI